MRKLQKLYKIIKENKKVILIFKSLQVSANGGVLELEQSTYVHTENSFIIRRQYWGEFLTKEIIFVLGWMVLVVNLKEALQFFKKS